MGQYTKTAAAGGIVLLIANYIFLFLFGADEDLSSSEAPAEMQKP
jgi:hypothetical protein